MTMMIWGSFHHWRTSFDLTMISGQDPKRLLLGGFSQAKKEQFGYPLEVEVYKKESYPNVSLKINVCQVQYVFF